MSVLIAPILDHHIRGTMISHMDRHPAFHQNL